MGSDFFLRVSSGENNFRTKTRKTSRVELYEYMFEKKITRPLAPFHDGTSCSFTLACLISIIIERLSKSKRCFSRPRWKLAQTANLARSSAWFRGIGVQISFVDGIIPDFVCFEKYFTFILPSRNTMRNFKFSITFTKNLHRIWTVAIY